MEELRESVRNLLSHVFRNYNIIDDISLHVRQFELTLYNMLSEYEYITKVYMVTNMLSIQDGFFPDDILGCKYLTNKITVKEIMNFDTTTLNNNPRHTIIKMYVTLLIKSHPTFAKDKNLTLSIAKTIEKTCYAIIIKSSKQSEDPPCRQWTSPLFLEMYSNRCGIIYNLLNPESSSCRLYGSTLLQSIIDGTIDISMIGSMSEKELCPQATQKERDEISLRSEQRVIEKESNLFKCPNCKERRVTYREVQLRAIDEAPDYLCKCLKCNHRFKGH